MADEQADSTINAIELATELTVAWLSNPNVRATAEEVPAFLRKMHETIGDLSKAPDVEAPPPAPEYVPAVPIRSSVKPDHIVSLIDGRKLKTLKRHLATHGLTPRDYRERYGLKPDYPMVASTYSAHRREVAEKLGLGRKPRAAAMSAAPGPAVTATAAVTQSAPAKPKAAAKSPRKSAFAKVNVPAKPAEPTPVIAADGVAKSPSVAPKRAAKVPRQAVASKAEEAPKPAKRTRVKKPLVDRI